MTMTRFAAVLHFQKSEYGPQTNRVDLVAMSPNQYRKTQCIAH